MMKVNFSTIDDGVLRSVKSSTYSSSSELSFQHDNNHWQSDDTSSQASSTWSSSSHVCRSTSSFSSSDEMKKKNTNERVDGTKPLPPPVLVYHESARSIVFRDNMHKFGDVAAEQIASILVGSASPKPDFSGRENHGCNRRHTALLVEGHSPSPVEDDRHLDHSFEDSACVGEGNESITNSFPKDQNEAKAQDGATDTPNQRSSDLLLLNGVLGRNSSYSVDIRGFQPQIVPLPRLQLGRNDEFRPLIVAAESQEEHYWNMMEKKVYHMIMDQQATVKTIKNTDWNQFLHRFKTSRDPINGEEYRNKRDDIGPHHASHIENGKDFSGSDFGNFPYNSFVTSTTLLPSGGIKMRAYGTTSTYTTGVVFALPRFNNDQLEEDAAKSSNTWSWPSGYSAKTEFNVDRRGELINGRAEALVPLSKLRRMNNDYVSKNEYAIAGRIVKGGLKTVPYNEVFLRVGGRGRRTLNGAVLSDDERSFEKGVGLPVALFCRTASFGHLFSLLRTRSRMIHHFGEKQMKDIPLLMIKPDLSIRVLTEKLQHELIKVAAQHLNPFQNSLIAHKTTIDHTDPECMQTKVEELIDLDDKMRETLTREELVRIAGGFGATDDSVAKILRDAMIQDNYTKDRTIDKNGDDERHQLQDIVNEGLAASVRASDYYTSRQLLILYSLVSSEGHQISCQTTSLSRGKTSNDANIDDKKEQNSLSDSKAMLMKYNRNRDPNISSTANKLMSRPPPPPLDTDRLRSATNSDGLLAVLGAAQILKAMQDGGAKRRTKESWEAVEEWVEQGERNIAFRLASWRDQRAAQGDLEIAVDHDSSFMAFVSGKAISNRRNFALQLHRAVEQTEFNDMRFLLAIDEITNRMHSPCLRLELLQYVLGLDNRYSIAHVKRSVELAATCLNISCTSEK